MYREAFSTPHTFRTTTSSLTSTQLESHQSSCFFLLLLLVWWLLLLSSVYETYNNSRVCVRVCVCVHRSNPRLPTIAGRAWPSLTGRGRDWRDRREGTSGRVPGAAGQRYHQLAGAGVVAVFAQPHPLPRAERQFAVGDRDCQWAAEKARFHVGGHIIRTFTGMSVR